jgi:hypothetical protein
MKPKAIIAAAVAAAFAFPIAALAGGDKASSGSSGDGGAEAMFKALDKNNDGFITKEEAKGTPHDKDFSSLDKNNDGKLSRQEHAAAPEHAGGDKSSSGSSASQGSGSASGSASGGSTDKSSSKY